MAVQIREKLEDLILFAGVLKQAQLSYTQMYVAPPVGLNVHKLNRLICVVKKQIEKNNKKISKYQYLLENYEDSD